MGDRPSGSDLDIIELVCSRLCHDLISPVGAVGNGLELMAEEGDEELTADARRLVESSCQRAAALLQLYRCAYGSAGNQPAFGPAEAVKLARGVIDAAKVRLDADDIPFASWPAGLGKLTLNGILTALEWLPRGGVLALTVSADEGGTGGLGLALSAEGPQIIVNADCMPLLQCDRTGVDVTVHNIHPYFTGLVAKNHGFRLKITQPNAGKVILEVERGV